MPIDLITLALARRGGRGGSLKGNDLLDAEMTAGVKVGGVAQGKKFPAGTPLEQVVGEILGAYRKPSVSFTFTPPEVLYASTDQLPSVDINITVVKESEDVKSIEVYAAGQLLATETADVANGKTFSITYTPDTPMTSNTAFRVVAKDVKDEATSVSKTIEFVGMSYYGFVDGDTPIADITPDMVMGLNEVLKNSKKYVYKNIAFDWGRICYAYPASLGALTSIKDEVNSINYTGIFPQQQLVINGLDYYLYVQQNPSAARNIELTFA